MAYTCGWGEPQHTYFQLANLFLAFTYLVPDNINGLLYLRLLLGFAGFFFMLWAWIILCSPDTFGWNLVFMIINWLHMIYLLYKRRSIKFSEDHEEVYGNIFEVLGVARWQYKPLVEIGHTVRFENGYVIGKEYKTLCDSLSLVIDGSVQVFKNDVFLHRTNPYEFINSPEWEAGNQNNGALPIVYEVTVVSEGCTVMVWNRNVLRRTLRKDKFLKNIFDSIIGQDVTRKLFKSTNNRRLFYREDDVEFGYVNNGGEDMDLVLDDAKSRRSYSMIYDATITQSNRVPVSLQVPDINENQSNGHKNKETVIMEDLSITVDPENTKS